MRAKEKIEYKVHFNSFAFRTHSFRMIVGGVAGFITNISSEAVAFIHLTTVREHVFGCFLLLLFLLILAATSAGPGSVSM